MTSNIQADTGADPPRPHLFNSYWFGYHIFLGSLVITTLTYNCKAENPHHNVIAIRETLLQPVAMPCRHFNCFGTPVMIAGRLTNGSYEPHKSYIVFKKMVSNLSTE